VLWDAGYCLLRPRSMEGGDLAWIWKPYVPYATIDATYRWEAFNNNEGFTGAQSAMNIVEAVINFVYLYLGSDAPLAPLVGFLASSRPSLRPSSTCFGNITVAGVVSGRTISRPSSFYGSFLACYGF
ncbi:hypothetical protein FRB94_001597, partial [Tulasnella sp. JGI-2019a]